VLLLVLVLVLVLVLLLLLLLSSLCGWCLSLLAGCPYVLLLAKCGEARIQREEGEGGEVLAVALRLLPVYGCQDLAMAPSTAQLPAYNAKEGD
jgi:hypothetical protein